MNETTVSYQNKKESNQEKSHCKAKVVKDSKFKKYRNMTYMDIIQYYEDYPNEELQYSVLEPDITKVSIPDNVITKIFIGKGDYVENKKNFISEQDKADGWIENYSSLKKFSKFLQTNLHYLPEHLWDKMSEVYQDKILIGYRVRDKYIYFFVHVADTDNLSRELYKYIKNPQKTDKERINDIVFQMEEKGIYSWLTIRVRKYLNLF